MKHSNLLDLILQAGFNSESKNLMMSYIKKMTLKDLLDFVLYCDNTNIGGMGVIKELKLLLISK